MAIFATDIIDFILRYRRGKAFQDWSVEDIVKALRNHYVGVIEEDGVFLGIVFAKRDSDKKTLHVSNILTIRRGVLKKFFELFAKHYAGWSITGNRRGKLKSFSRWQRIYAKL